MTEGFARRLRTFCAPGLEATTSAPPSHQNQIGTMCGAPSGRTVDSHTTGSSSRNRRIRALATVGLLMSGACAPASPA